MNALVNAVEKDSVIPAGASFDAKAYDEEASRSHALDNELMIRF